MNYAEELLLRVQNIEKLLQSGGGTSGSANVVLAIERSALDKDGMVEYNSIQEFCEALSITEQQVQDLYDGKYVFIRLYDNQEGQDYFYPIQHIAYDGDESVVVTYILGNTQLKLGKNEDTYVTYMGLSDQQQ